MGVRERWNWPTQPVCFPQGFGELRGIAHAPDTWTIISTSTAKPSGSDWGQWRTGHGRPPPDRIRRARARMHRRPRGATRQNPLSTRRTHGRVRLAVRSRVNQARGGSVPTGSTQMSGLRAVHPPGQARRRRAHVPLRTLTRQKEQVAGLHEPEVLPGAASPPGSSIPSSASRASALLIRPPRARAVVRRRHRESPLARPGKRLASMIAPGRSSPMMNG